VLHSQMSASSSSYSGMQMMNCCQIATKKHDGGSSEEANQPKRRSVFIEGRSDAFSLYSNKAVRMDRLLSSHRRAPVHLLQQLKSQAMIMIPVTTTSWTHRLRQRLMLLQAVDHRPPRRVTRLSFEVHPSLILDPILLSAVGGMGDSSTLPTNIIFDDEKKN
jgi:hypothetical protein